MSNQAESLTRLKGTNQAGKLEVAGLNLVMESFPSSRFLSLSLLVAVSFLFYILSPSHYLSLSTLLLMPHFSRCYVT